MYYFCTKCGGTFSPDNKWCPNCDSMMVEHTEELRRFNDWFADRERRRRVIVDGILLVVAIFVAAVAAYTYWRLP